MADAAVSLGAMAAGALICWGVDDVHDLHVWTITSGMESLSAHVVTHDARKAPDLFGELRDVVHDRFGIDHRTFQSNPRPSRSGRPGCDVFPAAPSWHS